MICCYRCLLLLPFILLLLLHFVVHCCCCCCCYCFVVPRFDAFPNIYSVRYTLLLFHVVRCSHVTHDFLLFTVPVAFVTLFPFTTFSYVYVVVRCYVTLLFPFVLLLI